MVRKRGDRKGDRLERPIRTGEFLREEGNQGLKTSLTWESTNSPHCSRKPSKNHHLVHERAELESEGVRRTQHTTWAGEVLGEAWGGKVHRVISVGSMMCRQIREGERSCLLPP